MKKIVIAAAAVLTALMLTACGSGKKNDGSGRVKKLPPKNTVTDAEDVTDTTAEESVIPAVADDSNSAAETSVPAADNSGTPEVTTAEQPSDGAPFTFKADNSKWNVVSDTASASITYNGDDIDFAKGNCTIMINSRTVEDMENRVLSELADAILDSKGLTSSVEVQKRGESVLGGHDAYTLNCLYTVNGVTFDLDINVMAEGTQVIEVWVMSYQDCTDAMQDNFDEVLNTISFA